MNYNLLISFFTIALITSFSATKELTQEQAIQRAELFIADNGYTALPGDRSKCTYELLDRLGEENIDSILKRRHNKLHPKAFCISKNEKEWAIGFLSTSIDLNKIDDQQRQTDLAGRVVLVEKYGKEIRMAHKEPLFSHFKKL